MTETVMAAVVQMTSTADVERNLASAESLVRRASSLGARFVSLRGSASDSLGNQVEQTIIRAFGLAP